MSEINRDLTSGPERLFGLIGFPLIQSFSKKYFDKKFEREGLTNCRFQNFPIPSIDSFLPDVINANTALQGIAVTIPYKRQVLSFLDDRTNIPAELDACNCIRVRNGKLEGHNTDAKGFEESLKPLLSPAHRKAIILGSGGAAQAIRYSLNNLQIENVTVSRTASEDLLTYSDLDQGMMMDHKLIINTTPAGMFPDVEGYPDIPYHLLTSEHLLYDVVYNPVVTEFMKRGLKMGSCAVNGEEMLAIQAEENWRIWNS